MSKIYKFNGEEIHVDSNDYDHIKNLVGEIDDISEIEDINSKIIVLFRLKRFYDAWELMDDNYDKIDFDKIYNDESYRVDLECETGGLYDKLYDARVMNDEQYAIHNILCGDLNPQFWDAFIEANYCKTFTDVCNLFKKIYNGIDETDSYSVKFNDYVKSLIDKYTKDDEIIDINILRVISLPDSILYELFDNGHISENDASDLFYEILYTKLMNGEDTSDFWDKFIEVSDKADFSNFRTPMLDSSIYSLLNNVYKFENKKDLLISLFVNNVVTTTLIYTINNELKSMGINLFSINLSDYLLDMNLSLVPSYKALGVNTKDYETLNVIINHAMSVYNRKNNTISMHNKVYDAKDVANLSIWNSFIDDPTYEYHEMDDFEKSLSHMCEREGSSFLELMYALCDLVSKIEK